MSEHLPQARESAQRTYDRRRARRAADTLAQIPPNRWDDETRRIIATLATISAPSRIDDLLAGLDGEPLEPRLFTHDAPPDGETAVTPIETRRLDACRDVCGGNPLTRPDDAHRPACPYYAMVNDAVAVPAVRRAGAR